MHGHWLVALHFVGTLFLSRGQEQLNGLALCAGVGGLELGLKLAIPEYRCVGYVEREAFAASILVARMEDKTLDQAPIWDCLESFEGSNFADRVDVISAGFPCQPWSSAGKRKGKDDDRWIWPAINRIICEVGPSIVFLENVPGLLIGGLGDVLGDLAQAGFDAEWGCYTATEVGASHKRERVFILAYRQGHGLQAGRLSQKEWHGQFDGYDKKLANTDIGTRSAQQGEQHEKWYPKLGGGGEKLADSKDTHRRAGVQGIKGKEGSRRRGYRGIGAELGNPRGKGLARCGPIGFQEKFTFPPGPSDYERWSRYDGPGPAIRRGSDGMANRVDRLRACGNGVVPLEAAYAFRTLAARAGLI